MTVPAFSSWRLWEWHCTLSSARLCCCRDPKNRKVLQKVFASQDPKLLGFVSKVPVPTPLLVWRLLAGLGIWSGHLLCWNVLILCAEASAQSYIQDSDMAGFKSHFIASAKALGQGLHFIFAESSANNGALGFFGLKDADVPAYVIHDSQNDDKFVKANADPADLTKFVEDFKVRTAAPCQRMP